MKHVFYAVDCGIHDADGELYIKFGISSEDGLAKRVAAFSTLAMKPPVVLGIATFMTRRQALSFEAETLSKFVADAPPQRRQSELRKASPTVMRFIRDELYPLDTPLDWTPLEEDLPVEVAARLLTADSTIQQVMSAYKCSENYARTIRKERFGL